MALFDYQRFDFPKPVAVPSEQLDAINVEIARVASALADDDRPRVLGSLKDLVEAIARSVLEINGESAGRMSVGTALKRAQELLRTQPGPGLAHGSGAGNAANSASKIVLEIPNARNARGTGHGRAAVPEVTPDELTLLLDGALMWSRWALRRLDLFCMGRPDQLMSDLAGGQSWTRGKLAARLEATELSDDETARQVGHWVGRRAAGGTFVVRQEGIELPALSHDVNAWPEAYRIAAGRALLFDSTGEVTSSLLELTWAIRLMWPVIDADTWAEVVHELIEGLPDPRSLNDSADSRWRKELRLFLDEIAKQKDRLGVEAERLATHLTQ